MGLMNERDLGVVPIAVEALGQPFDPLPGLLVRQGDLPLVEGLKQTANTRASAATAAKSRRSAGVVRSSRAPASPANNSFLSSPARSSGRASGNFFSDEGGRTSPPDLSWECMEVSFPCRPPALGAVRGHSFALNA
jgi:hypothetical protein